LADRGWKRSFDEPITLPRGRELEDAGTYITKFPKAEHEDPARFHPDAFLPHQGTQVEIA
jgi:hypothetical protein